MSLLPLTFEKKEETVRNERNTQAILREMHDTHAIASNTIVALNEDDDKLREAHLTLANIQDNLNKTDVSLASIGSWWGWISTKYLTPASSPTVGVHSEAAKRFDAKIEAEKKAKIEHAHAEHEKTIEALKLHKGKSMADSLPPSNDPHILKGREYMRDQDKDLDEMGDLLAQIKLSSMHMNTILDSQNKRLNKMNEQTSRAEDHIKKNTDLAVKYAK